MDNQTRIKQLIKIHPNYPIKEGEIVRFFIGTRVQVVRVIKEGYYLAKSDYTGVWLKSLDPGVLDPPKFVTKEYLCKYYTHDDQIVNILYGNKPNV